MISSFFGVGLQHDIDGDYELAIDFYEKAIIYDTVKDEELYANLSVIYWLLVTDNNFPPIGSIKDQFRTNGLKRYKDIVEDGIVAFPKSTELLFWNKYFPYRMYFSSFSFQECQALYEDPSLVPSLVPSFYLNLYDEAQYREATMRLVEECLKRPTAKNNYIISVANL